jgi:hypothetical protein
VDDFLFPLADAVLEGFLVRKEKVGEITVIPDAHGIVYGQRTDVAFHLGEEGGQHEVHLLQLVGQVRLDRPEPFLPEAPVQDTAEDKHEGHHADYIEDQQFSPEFHFWFTA